ncbi:Gfo/Idh/MocA family oxidoreductase [Nonomuraea sp. B19D2]|uniref:Gfo/Idh/MocA family protein n=1 Tax=Nonomuraea sp. B19D2 TaxID=3159561 RepID=UPI0032DA6B89
MRPVIGIGMVGYAFMGRTHSQAWRSVDAFFDLPFRPSMVAVAGRSAEATAQAAEKLGWAGAETDWKRLLDRDDVQVVDICTPGDSHAEIAVAALAAGKHVICEKPLANTVAEAEAMAVAAKEAAARGVRSMVAFNYRRVPAVALARRFVEEACSAISGMYGRSICRTGSSTRNSPWSGGSRRTRPALGPSATSAPWAAWPSTSSR